MMGSEKDQSTKTAIMELTMLKGELLVVCEDVGFEVNEEMSRSEISKEIGRQASEVEMQEALVVFKKKEERQKGEREVKREREKEERELKRKELENESKRLGLTEASGGAPGTSERGRIIPHG